MRQARICTTSTDGDIKAPKREGSVRNDLEHTRSGGQTPRRGQPKRERESWFQVAGGNDVNILNQNSSLD